MRSAVQTFAEEKTEAGTPAHPHFSEVERDMAIQAEAIVATGVRPDLNSLYDNASWANPGVREKLLAAEQRHAAAKRDADERARIA